MYAQGFKCDACGNFKEVKIIDGEITTVPEGWYTIIRWNKDNKQCVEACNQGCLAKLAGTMKIERDIQYATADQAASHMAAMETLSD